MCIRVFSFLQCIENLALNLYICAIKANHGYISYHTAL